MKKTSLVLLAIYYSLQGPELLKFTYCFIINKVIFEQLYVTVSLCTDKSSVMSQLERVYIYSVLVASECTLLISNI